MQIYENKKTSDNQVISNTGSRIRVWGGNWNVLKLDCGKGYT